MKTMKRILALSLLLVMVCGSAMAAWQRDGYGWRWRKSDGTYARMEWQKIKNVWYAFDNTGYMLTGSYWSDGTWYYFDASGAMATGWRLIDGYWYYFTSSGAMARNCWISGKYYVGSDGAMLTNTWTPDGYWVDQNGRWVP